MQYKCPKCGNLIEEGTNPCPNCGQRFNWPSPKVETPPENSTASTIPNETSTIYQPTNSIVEEPDSDNENSEVLQTSKSKTKFKKTFAEWLEIILYVIIGCEICYILFLFEINNFNNSNNYNDDFVVFIIIAIAIALAIGFFLADKISNNYIRAIVKFFCSPGLALCGILVLLFAIIGIFLMASSKSDNKSSYNFNTFKSDAANDKYKRAAHNKAVADSMLNSSDPKKRQEAQFLSARAEKEMNTAMAEMLEVKSGNSYSASKMKTAANNKATADMGKINASSNNYIDASMRSAFAEGDMNVAKAELLQSITGNYYAGKKMKTAAHNKSVADAGMVSKDSHVRANSEFISAREEAKMNEAFADLIASLPNK